MIRRIVMTAGAAALGLGFASSSFAADAAMSSVDTNGDGVAQYSEMTALFPKMSRVLFTVMDGNKNGVVEQKELMRPAAQQVLESFGRQKFKAAVSGDLDGNGSISFEELSTVLPGFQQGLYDSMDLNTDGKLDLLEFNTGHARTTIDSFRAAVQYVNIQANDTDGDGVLSDEELAQVIPNYQPGSYKKLEKLGPYGRRILVPTAMVSTSK